MSQSSSKRPSRKRTRALPSLSWSKADARLFQLHAVGLHGRKYARGAEGIRQCFDQLDVLQLDALPLMGRNHDLVVQARVDGTHPDQTLDLIHEERLGFEYWDKVYCAVPLKHFPMLRAYMANGQGKWHLRRKALIEENSPNAVEKILQTIKKQGAVSSREISDFGAIPVYNSGWKPPKITSMALDVLWHEGRITTTHRVNYRKYFDVTERVLPKSVLGKKALAGNNLWKTWLKKRVRNVGLLPLKGDAESWALVSQAKTLGLIDPMIQSGELTLVHVDDVNTPFLAPSDATDRLKQAQKTNLSSRARFIAPLDQIIWSRQAVASLWDFDYVWEVYKPAAKRQWGYYVLPVLHRDRFVARFDGKYDSQTGTLHVVSYYQEPGGLPVTHAAIEAAFRRFLRYLGGEAVKLPPKKKRN